MTWTTEKPTKPGWYWWRSSAVGVLEIVKVYKKHTSSGSTLNISFMNTNRFFLDDINGDWSGPLDPPKEE